MSLNQPLEFFLSRLAAKLVDSGISARRAIAICAGIKTGNGHDPLGTLAAYQEAWTVLDAARDIITSGSYSSRARRWFAALNLVVGEFEDAYEAQHGSKPFNTGGAAWCGTSLCKVNAS
jgi:hypothetical protein